MNAPAVISAKRVYSCWPELMKGQTAADYLDMSYGSFLNMVEEGVFPEAIMRRPGMVRWRKSEIDAALANRNESEKSGGPKPWPKD